VVAHLAITSGGAGKRPFCRVLAGCVIVNRQASRPPRGGHPVSGSRAARRGPARLNSPGSSHIAGNQGRLPRLSFASE